MRTHRNEACYYGVFVSITWYFFSSTSINPLIPTTSGGGLVGGFLTFPNFHPRFSPSQPFISQTQAVCTSIHHQPFFSVQLGASAATRRRFTRCKIISPVPPQLSPCPANAGTGGVLAATMKLRGGSSEDHIPCTFRQKTLSVYVTGSDLWRLVGKWSALSPS